MLTKFTIMTNVKRVFVDTSYWIALIERGEKSHRQVAKSFITLQKNGTQFFTNDYVLDEAWTRLITGNHFQEAKMLKERVCLAEANHEITLLYTDKKCLNKPGKHSSSLPNRNTSKYGYRDVVDWVV